MHCIAFNPYFGIQALDVHLRRIVGRRRYGCTSRDHRLGPPTQEPSSIIRGTDRQTPPRRSPQHRESNGSFLRSLAPLSRPLTGTTANSLVPMNPSTSPSRIATTSTHKSAADAGLFREPGSSIATPSGVLLAAAQAMQYTRARDCARSTMLVCVAILGDQQERGPAVARLLTLHESKAPVDKPITKTRPTPSGRRGQITRDAAECGATMDYDLTPRICATPKPPEACAGIIRFSGVNETTGGLRAGPNANNAEIQRPPATPQPPEACPGALGRRMRKLGTWKRTPGGRGTLGEAGKQRGIEDTLPQDGYTSPRAPRALARTLQARRDAGLPRTPATAHDDPTTDGGGNYAGLRRARPRAYRIALTMRHRPHSHIGQDVLRQDLQHFEVICSSEEVKGTRARSARRAQSSPLLRLAREAAFSRTQSALPRTRLRDLPRFKGNSPRAEDEGGRASKLELASEHFKRASKRDSEKEGRGRRPSPLVFPPSPPPSSSHSLAYDSLTRADHSKKTPALSGAL
ncbi:hypothetical protein EV714DRAFT_235136 [Schizophyllum commune]